MASSSHHREQELVYEDELESDPETSNDEMILESYATPKRKAKKKISHDESSVSQSDDILEEAEKFLTASKKDGRVGHTQECKTSLATYFPGAAKGRKIEQVVYEMLK